MVLIKVVISALPIFQFSSLLAPISVKYSIAQEIRKFLWQGRKTNTERMHLVNWNIVRAPKTHGGLGILDPTLSNISLGDKILWRLVIGKQEWWKHFLVHKCLEGDQLHCLDTTPPTQPGSPIWKLLKPSLSLFHSKSTWILENRKQISIWEDYIMGNPLLRENKEQEPLFLWFSEHGINTLFYLSIWNPYGSWVGWLLANHPPHLLPIF